MGLKKFAFGVCHMHILRFRYPVNLQGLTFNFSNYLQLRRNIFLCFVGFFLIKY